MFYLTGPVRHVPLKTFVRCVLQAQYHTYLEIDKFQLKFQKIVKTKRIKFSRFAKIGHLKTNYYCVKSMPNYFP